MSTLLKGTALKASCHLPLLADVLRPALPQHLRGLVTRLQYCDADGEYPLLSQTSVTSQVRQHINQPMKLQFSSPSMVSISNPIV